MKKLFTLLLMLNIAVFSTATFAVHKNMHTYNFNRLDELSHLFYSQQYSQAFALSETLYPKYVKNVDFLWLRACSAYMTRNYNESIEALTQVIAEDPYHVEARILLAKTYIQTYYDEQALLTLQKIQQYHPTNAQQQKTNELIKHLHERQYRPYKMWWDVTGKLGYDSHPGRFITEDGIHQSHLGFFNEVETKEKRSSIFAEGGLSVGGQVPLFRGTLSGEVAASHREYLRHTEFDIESYSLAANLAWPFRYVQVNLPVFFQQQAQGGGTIFNDAAVGLNLSMDIAQDKNITGFIEHDNFTYIDRSAKSGPYTVYGLRWLQNIDCRNLLVMLQPYLGEQNINGREYNFNSRSLGGFSMELEFRHDQPWRYIVKAMYQHSDFDLPNPAHYTSDERDDDYIRLGFEIEHDITKHWLTSLGYSYINNQSNISLFDTTEHLLEFMLQYH